MNTVPERQKTLLLKPRAKLFVSSGIRDNRNDHVYGVECRPILACKWNGSPKHYISRFVCSLNKQYVTGDHGKS